MTIGLDALLLNNSLLPIDTNVVHGNFPCKTTTTCIGITTRIYFIVLLDHLIKVETTHAPHPVCFKDLALTLTPLNGNAPKINGPRIRKLIVIGVLVFLLFSLAHSDLTVCC